MGSSGADASGLGTTGGDPFFYSNPKHAQLTPSPTDGHLGQSREKVYVFWKVK